MMIPKHIPDEEVAELVGSWFPNESLVMPRNEVNQWLREHPRERSYLLRTAYIRGGKSVTGMSGILFDTDNVIIMDIFVNYLRIGDI